MSSIYMLLAPLIPIIGAFIAAIIVRSRRARIASTTGVSPELRTAPRWVKVAMWCLVALMALVLIPTVAILVLAR